MKKTPMFYVITSDEQIEKFASVKKFIKSKSPEYKVQSQDIWPELKVRVKEGIYNNETQVQRVSLSPLEQRKKVREIIKKKEKRIILSYSAYIINTFRKAVFDGTIKDEDVEVLWVNEKGIMRKMHLEIWYRKYFSKEF